MLLSMPWLSASSSLMESSFLCFLLSFGQETHALLASRLSVPLSKESCEDRAMVRARISTKRQQARMQGRARKPGSDSDI